MAAEVVVLFASATADPRAKANTDSLTNLLQMRGIPFIMVDGASPEHKDARGAMFAASGKRGVYPQVLYRFSTATAGSAGHSFMGVTMPSADDRYEFIGDWDAVQALNELNDTAHGFDTAFSKSDEDGRPYFYNYRTGETRRSLV